MGLRSRLSLFSFCFCNQLDDGYILAETYSWFCIVNKLLCLDWVYRTSDYNKRICWRGIGLCVQSPQQKYPSECTHSKNDRLKNPAGNSANCAKNSHEKNKWLSNAYFFNTLKPTFDVNNTVCLHYEFAEGKYRKAK